MLYPAANAWHVSIQIFRRSLLTDRTISPSSLKVFADHAAVPGGILEREHGPTGRLLEDARERLADLPFDCVQALPLMRSGVQHHAFGADRVGDRQGVNHGIDRLLQHLRVLGREVREVDVVHPHLADRRLGVQLSEACDRFGLVIRGAPRLRRAREDLNRLGADLLAASDRGEDATRRGHVRPHGDSAGH